MFGDKVRHVLHKVHKRWLVVGITALALGLVTTAQTTEASDKVRINYIVGANVGVWQDSNASQLTGKQLPTNTQWASYGAVAKPDGTFYVNVGQNQWLDSNYADFSGETSDQILRGVVIIQQAAGIGLPIWNSPSDDRQVVSRQVLPNRSSWQVYRRAVTAGHTWYSLGSDRWIDGDFAKLIVQQSRGPKTYQSGGPTVMKPAPVTPIVQKVSYRVVTRDQYGAIVSTRTYEGNIGDTITIGAIGIDGYTLNDGSTKTIRLSADSGQNDINFAYTRNTPINPNQGGYVPSAVTPQYVNYRILAVDDQGRPIQGYIPSTGSALPRAGVNAPTISGYAVSGARTINVGVNGGDIKFIYTRDAVKDVSYTIKAVDDQEKVISSFTSGDKSGQPGATITAPPITGYTVTGASTAPIPATGGPIIFKYTKNTPTTPAAVSYMIKIVDDQGNPISGYPDQTGQGAPGTTIPVPPVTGYTIKTPTTATVPAAGGVVTFTYTQDAPAVTTVKYTIAYVDEDKQPITTTNPASGEGKVGDPISALPIPGYTAPTETQTLKSDTTTVTFVYKKDAVTAATVKYTIEYLDQANQQAIVTSEPTSGEGKVGDDVTAPNITGYTADKATATQKLKSDTTAIKFTYTQNAPAAITYTINFVDQAGDKIQDPQTGVTGKVNDEIPAPDIPGYTAPTVKQVLKADTTALTFTYTKKIAQTTVQFVDGNSGTAIADPATVTTKQTYPAQTVINAKNGNSYIILDGQNFAVDPVKQPTLTIKYKLITGIVNAVDADTGKVIKQISGPTPLTYQDGWFMISFISQALVTEGQGNEYAAAESSESGATVSTGAQFSNADASDFPMAFTVKYKKVTGPTAQFTPAEQARVTQLQQGFAALPKPVMNNQIFATVPSYKPFNAGSTTATFQQQTYTVFNFFRSIWGLPTTTIDPIISNRDQTASSFMAGYMAGLQHFVDGSDGNTKYDKPADMSADDWQKVNDSLKYSNIASLGTITPLDQTMIGFLADNHNLFGANAGHRLNMLRPNLVQSGVGVGLAANAAVTGQKATSNLTLDVWTGKESSDTYTQDGGVMFFPGTSVFPIELLPAGTPISAASYGNIDLTQVTKVTVEDMTLKTSQDITGDKLLLGGPGKGDAYGDAKTTITASGYVFSNKHQYKITFYGDGLPGGSISTTFKTFSFAG